MRMVYRMYLPYSSPPMSGSQPIDLAERSQLTSERTRNDQVGFGQEQESVKRDCSDTKHDYGGEDKTTVEEANGQIGLPSHAYALPMNRIPVPMKPFSNCRSAYAKIKGKCS